MVVSKVNLTLKTFQDGALAWATDLQSGQPVSGLNVTFYDSQARQVGAATTGSDGVAQIALDGSQRDLVGGAGGRAVRRCAQWMEQRRQPVGFPACRPSMACRRIARTFTPTAPSTVPARRFTLRASSAPKTTWSTRLPTGQAKVHVTVRSPKRRAGLGQGLAARRLWRVQRRGQAGRWRGAGAVYPPGRPDPVKYSEPSPGFIPGHVPGGGLSPARVRGRRHARTRPKSCAARPCRSRCRSSISLAAAVAGVPVQLERAGGRL